MRPGSTILPFASISTSAELEPVFPISLMMPSRMKMDELRSTSRSWFCVTIQSAFLMISEGMTLSRDAWDYLVKSQAFGSGVTKDQMKDPIANPMARSRIVESIKITFSPKAGMSFAIWLWLASVIQLALYEIGMVTKQRRVATGAAANIPAISIDA